MEHADLIQEMPHIEQMPTQERLILAKKRRNHQLKVWSQKEKEYSKKAHKPKTSNKRNIFFSESVVLLEAASRNDIDEGLSNQISILYIGYLSIINLTIRFCEPGCDFRKMVVLVLFIFIVFPWTCFPVDSPIMKSTLLLCLSSRVSIFNEDMKLLRVVRHINRSFWLTEFFQYLNLW